jgi:hypothetical protein
MRRMACDRWVILLFRRGRRTRSAVRGNSWTHLARTRVLMRGWACREGYVQHPVRTLDPEEAEFFFVPIYPECYLFRENQRAGKDALRNTNRWFRSMLQIVTHQLPYWNRTQGRDHVFVFAGARGPHIFQVRGPLAAAA